MEKLTNEESIVNFTTNSASSSVISNYLPYQYPYGHYPYGHYSYVIDISYNISLKQVENGWILKKNGKEFIIKKLEEIVKILTEEK